MTLPAEHVFESPSDYFWKEDQTIFLLKMDTCGLKHVFNSTVWCNGINISVVVTSRVPTSARYLCFGLRPFFA